MLHINIQSNLGFRLVTPEDVGIIEQLLSDDKCDKVHPIPQAMDDFIAYRVGGVKQTRQTWVRLSEDGDVTAALYSARFDDPIMNPTKLCGDVAGILNTPSQTASAISPQSIIFYSISSFRQGEGKKLIYGVHDFFNQAAQFPETPVLSTLSPLRGFSSWLGESYKNPEILKGDEERLRSEAFKYLSQNINPVQKFHMRNGAAIYDVKMNANITGSEDCKQAFNVMVNYGYASLQSVQRNVELYSQNILPISRCLLGQASRSCGLSHRFVVE